jgi:dTMP kinase
VTTREPGGTPGAEAIRALLVQGAADRWAASTELLLLVAARDDHVRRVIQPALATGKWVLCDRFVDSTRVYQGIAGGLGIERIDRLHALLLPELRPDLTLLLDLEPRLGLARRGAEHAEGRFESKGPDYHACVRDGFRRLAEAEPGRFAMIDAAPPPAQVAEAVWAAVSARLPVRP